MAMHNENLSTKETPKYHLLLSSKVIDMTGLQAPEQSELMPKKRLWTPEEDKKLSDYINTHNGRIDWSYVSKLTGRCTKSCHHRWRNYLRPGIKRGSFSQDEVHTIISLKKDGGKKWSFIATHLPGRTNQDIKNFWYTHEKKKETPRVNQSQILPSPNKLSGFDVTLNPQAQLHGLGLNLTNPNMPNTGLIPDPQVNDYPDVVLGSLFGSVPNAGSIPASTVTASPERSMINQGENEITPPAEEISNPSSTSTTSEAWLEAWVELAMDNETTDSLCGEDISLK